MEGDEGNEKGEMNRVREREGNDRKEGEGNDRKEGNKEKGEVSDTPFSSPVLKPVDPNQSVSQPTSQPTNQSTQSTSQPTSQPTSQSTTTQPTTQPTNPSTTQPTTQPTSPPLIAVRRREGTSPHLADPHTDRFAHRIPFLQRMSLSYGEDECADARALSLQLPPPKEKGKRRDLTIHEREILSKEGRSPAGVSSRYRVRALWHGRPGNPHSRKLLRRIRQVPRGGHAVPRGVSSGETAGESRGSAGRRRCLRELRGRFIAERASETVRASSRQTRVETPSPIGRRRHGAGDETPRRPLPEERDSLRGVRSRGGVRVAEGSSPAGEVSGRASGGRR